MRPLGLFRGKTTPPKSNATVHQSLQRETQRQSLLRRFFDVVSMIVMYEEIGVGEDEEEEERKNPSPSHTTLPGNPTHALTTLGRRKTGITQERGRKR